MCKMFKPSSPRKAPIVFMICTSLLSCTTLAEELGLEDLPEDIAEEISNSYQNQINATNPNAIDNEVERLAHTFVLSSAQKSGFKRLLTDFRSCHFAFDPTNGVPRHVSNIEFVVESDDAQEAVVAFFEKYNIALAEILNQKDTSTLIWGFPPILDRGEEAAVERASVRLTRTISDIPVEDDGIVVSLIRKEDNRWIVTGLNIDWTDRLPDSFDISELISMEEMEAAVESNLLTYSKYAIVVGTRYPEIKARLVLRAVGESRLGGSISYFDATSGELIKSIPNEQSYDYIGVLKAPATVPFEEAEFPKSCWSAPDSNCHPVPHTCVYDNSLWQGYNAAIDRLGSTVITENEIYTGDATTILGITDYDGNISVNGASGAIYIDNNKAYVYDNNYNTNLYAFDYSNKYLGTAASGLCKDADENPYECTSELFATPISAYINQPEQYAERLQNDYDRSPELAKIRQEVFFHLNYAAHNFSRWGVPIYKPVLFKYTRGSGVANAHCGGATWYDAVRYHCGILYDDNSYQNNCKEIEFRAVLYHEYGHTPYFKMGIDAIDGYYGHKVYAEAMSTISEHLLSQFESTLIESTYLIGANRKWPMAGQDDGTIYFRAGVFTSIFVDMTLMTGYSSVVPIYDSFLGTPTGTVMVGQCGSQTDPSTCPGNSYYQRVIAAARNAWGTSPWLRQDYEISKAFTNHIDDAVPYSEEPRCGPGCECDLECDSEYDPDCDPPCHNTCDSECVISPPECSTDCQTALFFDPVELADKDKFPLFDDVTDMFYTAAFVNQDIPATSSSLNAFDVIRYTPDPSPDGSNSQQLWFTNSRDYDVFSTYLRAGIAYSFYSYGTGTIPCMTLYKENLSYIGQTNTCQGGTSGSLSYTPTQDGIYLVNFSPAPGVTQFGPGYTYRFYRYSSGDDYPEAYSRAVPLPVSYFGYDSELVSGRFNTTSDIDTLYFYRSGAGYGEFSFTSNSAAIGFVVDSEEVPIAITVNNAAPVSFVMPEAGRYYVRMYSSTVQQYTLDVEIDDEDLGGGGAGNGDTSSAFQFSEGAVSDAPRIDTRYSSVRANLGSTSDKDYFEFEAEHGDVIHIHTTHLADGVDTVLTLYAPINAFQLYHGICPRIGDPADGDAAPPYPETYRRQLPLLIDDNGGVTYDGSSRLAFVAPVDGTYLVEVKSADSGTAGAYTVEMLRRTDLYSTTLVNTLFPVLPGE